MYFDEGSANLEVDAAYPQIFSANRILKTAFRLLDAGYDKVVINMEGGDAARHPLAPMLMEYAIAQPREVCFNLLTFALEDMGCYETLASTCGEHLAFHYTFHPLLHKHDNFFKLLKIVRDNNNKVLIRCCESDKDDPLFKALKAILEKFDKVIPVSVPLYYMEDQSDRFLLRLMDAEALQRRDNDEFNNDNVFAFPSMPEDETTDCDEIVFLDDFPGDKEAIFPNRAHKATSAGSDHPQDTRYCCPGTGIVQLNSDASWRGGFCDMVSWNEPLWMTATNPLLNRPPILPCSRGECVSQLNFPLAKFSNICQAYNYLEEREKLGKRVKLRKKPLLNPISRQVSGEHKILLMLSHLLNSIPESGMRIAEDAILENLQGITSVCQAMRDAKNQWEYLRTLIHAFGNILMENTQPTDPFTDRVTCKLAYDKPWRGSGHYCSWICVKDMDSPAKLDSYLCAIGLFKPKLQLALNYQSESLIGVPLAILAEEPSYKFGFANYFPDRHNLGEESKPFPVLLGVSHKFVQPYIC